MMPERTVSLDKPHIFRKRGWGWVCCQALTRLGWGNTPADAYASWQRANA